jgi:hypothetical protein
MTEWSADILWLVSTRIKEGGKKAKREWRHKLENSIIKPNI